MTRFRTSKSRPVGTSRPSVLIWRWPHFVPPAAARSPFIQTVHRSPGDVSIDTPPAPSLGRDVMRGKDFLTIRDFTSEELCQLVSLGQKMKAEPGRYSRVLEGQTLALIFEKPSLRTRVSFDVGMQQLGGFSVNLTVVGNQSRETRVAPRRRDEPGSDGPGHHDPHVRPRHRRAHGGVLARAGHQRAHRLQPPVPGHGGLHDRARAQGTARRRQARVRRRRQQRGELPDVRRGPLRRAVSRSRRRPTTSRIRMSSTGRARTARRPAAPAW